MGDTWAKIRIHGSRGSREVEALVDTGATFSRIPRPVAQAIGLEAKYQTQVELSPSFGWGENEGEPADTEAGKSAANRVVILQNFEDYSAPSPPRPVSRDLRHTRYPHNIPPNPTTYPRLLDSLCHSGTSATPPGTQRTRLS